MHTAECEHLFPTLYSIKCSLNTNEWADQSKASCLTLSGGFEVEGLESASEGRGVDDIDSVFALAPAVERHRYDEDGDGDGSCCQSRVQCHLAGAIHTCKSKTTEMWRFI